MTKRYLLLSVIVLVMLGTFLTLNVISSRRRMMELLKDEAGSLLNMIALSQENSIFAEGEYEDNLIEKTIQICSYLENTSISTQNLSKIREYYDISSIYVARAGDLARLVVSGSPVQTRVDVLSGQQPIFFEYFDIASRKYMRVVYRTNERIYQIECPATEVESFRQDFGINKFINQISTDPKIRYLVFQDSEGIIFATSNVRGISRIADDPQLLRVLEEGAEASRLVSFNDERLLELVRPFIIEGQTLGIFRIGLGLQSYFSHVQATERQLIGIFIVLLVAGSIIFFLFIRYQNYRNLKEIFDRTLGAIEDGVMTVERRGLITGVNRAFADLLGLEPRFLINHTYDAILKSDPFAIGKVIQESNKVRDEQIINGRHLLFTTYPLYIERRGVSGVIIIARDVTALREFEKEREESSRLKFLGNLVANFAHEIKNPLNGLSMAVQRLAKEFKYDDADYQKIIKVVLKEIGSLNKTLNDFLSLARPKMKSREPFSIVGAVNDALDLVREQTHETGINITTNMRDDFVIEGNRDDLRRAFLNILLNAVDAVSLIVEGGPEVIIDASQSGDHYQIVISDNGSGMDAEDQKRIFKPYFTTKTKGTGLGLYIAQEIIKNHNGTIKVDSKKGKGTKFIMSFGRSV